MSQAASTVAESPAAQSLMSRPSVLALLAGNLIPLLGVIFLHWDLRNILLLYWAESAVIGFYTILKMLLTDLLPAIGISIFFCVHYGLFMTVHLIFLLALTSGAFGHHGTTQHHAMFAGAANAVTLSMIIALVMLFITHGVSFVTHFLAKRQYLDADVNKLMAAPYPRIIVMHITIIGGAFLALAIGQPIALLIVLVILKTAVDLGSHLFEHRNT